MRTNGASGSVVFTSPVMGVWRCCDTLGPPFWVDSQARRSPSTSTERHFGWIVARGLCAFTGSNQVRAQPLLVSIIVRASRCLDPPRYRTSISRQRHNDETSLVVELASPGDVHTDARRCGNTDQGRTGRSLAPWPWSARPAPRSARLQVRVCGPLGRHCPGTPRLRDTPARTSPHRLPREPVHLPLTA